MSLIPRVLLARGGHSCACALLSASSSVKASTVVYRTDADLVRLSERVVRARVLRQRAERPLPNGSIFTVTTLAVLEDLTGRDGDIVEVWELGGVHEGEFLHVGGGVEYAPGTEVVVCLERGPRGLRSVAMGFSKFDVVTGGSAAGTLIRNMAETAVVGGPVAGLERRTLGQFRALAEGVTGRRARFARRELLLSRKSRTVNAHSRRYRPSLVGPIRDADPLVH